MTSKCISPVRCLPCRSGIFPQVSGYPTGISDSLQPKADSLPPSPSRETGSFHLLRPKTSEPHRALFSLRPHIQSIRNSGDSVFKIYLEATTHHPAAPPVVGATVVSGLNGSDSSALCCPAPYFHSTTCTHDGRADPYKAPGFQGQFSSMVLTEKSLAGRREGDGQGWSPKFISSTSFSS